MAAPRLACAVLLTLVSGAAAAEYRNCDVPAAESKHARVRSAADLAKLDPNAPVLAWIGIGKDDGAAPTLDPAVLRRLTLRPGSVVSGVVLKGANLTGWRAPGVVIADSDLSEANLTGADLSKGCIYSGSIENATLNEANLAGLVTDQTEIAGARFLRARMAGAALQCFATIVGSGCAYPEDGKALDFTGADLTGADLSAPVEVYGAKLGDAKLDRTTLPISEWLLKDMEAARLTSARLMPGGFRFGEGELFTAAEIAELKRLSGGTVTDLLRDLSASPGFDCGARLTPLESAICKSSSLASLDRAMADAYRRLLAAAPERPPVQAAQQAFLRARNACTADDWLCIRDRYIDRMVVIAQALAVPAPKAKVTFEDRPYGLTQRAGDAAVAAKLLRAWGTSGNIATLAPDGTALAIEATVIGPNTHQCEFSGDLARQPDGSWRDTDLDESLNWLLLPDALVMSSRHEEGRQFCGMRAGWPAVYFRKG